MSTPDPFANMLYSPGMGIALGLIQAGGPSRMPVSFGQALGQGMQTGQQFQQAGIQNAMQRLMLGQNAAKMQLFQNALNPQDNTQNAQPQTAMGINSATNGLNAPVVPNSPEANVGTGLSLGQQAPQQAQPAPQQTPQTPSLPRIDPYQDKIYAQNQHMAQVMDMIQPGSGAGYAAAAQQRLQDLNNQQLTFTGDQTKQFIPGGALPGQSIQYHPATGEWAVKGDPQWKDITYTDNVDGQTKHVLWNQATNQFKGIPGVTGSMPTTTPTGNPAAHPAIPQQVLKEYPGVANTPGIEQIPSQYLPMVSKIAFGDADYPTSAKRNPVFGQHLDSWITTLNPDWKEGTFSANKGMMNDLTHGADSKKIQAFNIIESHLSTYKSAMDALQNGDVQLANKLGNSVNLNMGKGPQAAVLAVKQLVAGELANAVAGGHVNESDKAAANDVLNGYNSPAQTDAVVQKIQALIGGKIRGMRVGYEASGLGRYFDARIGPEAQQAMQAAPETAPSSATTGLPPGWTVQVH